ncbi:alcohol dehydrogenase catalytic domain-containing protein (plasmid) [Haloterrigena salifodinae]|uniref:Alcohol dehydrogenase catalytic domain-containing protein n=1 Tax=Haloterrigena salifodinae TaxID=2675099 RepID=A0A8T8E7U1_9EURY|nr:scyllo-inosose 3-dehydrogenase [Haloterrigena salifodinae]QRV17693.1 alcohol dehydrogenase catalytic domain-containing protein [Haloterrigena salifodinae]
MESLMVDAEWDPRAEYDVSNAERESKKAMNASQVWRNPDLRVTERERPTPDGDEVLVRVRYAGICGSDVSMLETDEDGYVHYSAYLRLPNVTGHEFVGEVVETGDDARLFEEGDLVTAEVTDYCGRCNMCRQGFMGHCENFEQLGFTIPGAFAEYAAVPEKLCWDVSALRDAYETDDEALRAAATIEPSTITYHGLFARADGVLPGDYHVYHGAGPIGLTGMNVSRAAGAGKVIAFEPSDERREVARTLGFEHVYNPIEDDPVETIASVTDGEGADVHVETAGAVSQTYPAIEDSLAEGANVVHISNAASDPDIALRKYQGNNAQFYGSEGHTGQQVYPRVIRLMAAGQLDNRPLITSTFDLSNADEAIRTAAERVDGKVLIEI